MFLRKVYILPFILFLFCVIPLTWGHTEQIKKTHKILLYDLKPKEYQILFNLIWLLVKNTCEVQITFSYLAKWRYKTLKVI